MIRTYRRWQDVEPSDLRGHCAVVIDVLRWSTVVVGALANGAAWVEAWSTPEEARARAGVIGRDDVLLGGERGNVAPPGFDVGNSPREYAEGRVRGRGIITTTTNGTQGLAAAREAHAVLVGAFVNLPAVIEALSAARRDGRPVALIACGQAGDPSSEDIACAGALATAVGGLVTDVETEHACAAWARAGRDARKVMADAPHAATLRAAGFAGDVEDAAVIGKWGCLPTRSAEGRLIAM